MCPEVCDLGQLEGLADVLWASCIPPGAVGVPLTAAVPAAGSRPAVSQEPSACSDCRALHHTAPGMCQARQCPAAGHCCWPQLIRTFCTGPTGMLADRTDQASAAWQGVLTLCCLGQAPRAPTLSPATMGKDLLTHWQSKSERQHFFSISLGTSYPSESSDLAQGSL